MRQNWKALDLGRPASLTRLGRSMSRWIASGATAMGRRPSRPRGTYGHHRLEPIQRLRQAFAAPAGASALCGTVYRGRHRAPGIDASTEGRFHQNKPARAFLGEIAECSLDRDRRGCLLVNSVLELSRDK